MDNFVRLCAGILLALVLSLILNRQGKEFSALLVTAVCCITVVAAASFLTPLIDFFHFLLEAGSLDQELVAVVLKATGIGLLSEITCTICTDAGNAALGKILQIVASIVILWLSIPLFTSLLELVEDILLTI